MRENRIEPRRRIFKDAIIQSNGIGTSCTVRNVSGTGAFVVSDTSLAGEDLTLVIASEGLIKKCKVVWRDRDRFGVTFI